MQNNFHFKVKIAVFILFILTLVYPAKIFSQTAETNLQTPPVVITEIAANETSDAEWIEIYNKSEAVVDLTGWKFFEDGSNHGISPARGDAFLELGEYAVIANKADIVIQKYPDFSGAVFDSSWGSLKETGEEIGLKDSSGNFIEKFVYPQCGTTTLERIDVKSPADFSSNWANHPNSNSIGKAREIAVIVEEIGTTTADVGTSTEIGTSTEVGTTTETGTSTAENATTIIEEQTQTSVEQQIPSPAPNNPPQAVIQIQSGNLVALGETTLNFDGRASNDPDGDSISFFWDFGDGATSSSANPGPHAYKSAGIYVVKLSVVDSRGAQNQTQQFVQVLAKPAAAVSQTAVANGADIQSAAVQSTSAQMQNTQTQNAPSAEKSASALSLPLAQNLLINKPFEIKGYIVFVPSEAEKPQAAAAVKKSAATNKTTAKTTVKSTAKKSSSKKPVYKNGDTSNSIKITEIFPNPLPAENSEEWIEIFNAGKNPVNLGNWRLSDIAKKSSPYLIPDSLNLAPGKYAAFPKSQTKISLNNGSDSVFLSDFNGNFVDGAAYENGKQGFSYALVNFETWEWIDSPSPGKPNPRFEKLTGKVQGLIAGSEAEVNSFDIEADDGEKKIINFDEKILDPSIAHVALAAGADISLQVQRLSDGSYELKKIDEVRPAPAASAEKPAQSKSGLIWLSLGFIAAGLLLTGIARALRKPRQCAKACSQKDKISELEIFSAPQ